MIQSINLLDNCFNQPHQKMHSILNENKYNLKESNELRKPIPSKGSTAWKNAFGFKRK